MPIKRRGGSGGTALSEDVVDALEGASAPDAENPFATVEDIPADLSADVKAALAGAASPSAENPFATVAEAGDMTKAVYDTDNDGKVDAAEVADTAAYATTAGTATTADTALAVAWDGVTDPPADYPPAPHTLDAHTSCTLAELNAKVSDKTIASTDAATTSAAGLSLVPTRLYARSAKFARASANTLSTPAINVEVNGVLLSLAAGSIDLNATASWDAATYATPANRAGKDFYVYATADGLLLSANATYPTGYDADTSRKIAGIHCLCVAVNHNATLTAWAAGTVIALGESRKATTPDGYIYRCIAVEGTAKTHAATEPTWSGVAVGGTVVDNEVTWLKEVHMLEGFAAGDILPASVWDLEHRPICSPEGMVWSESAGIWVDIYLQSGTGTLTKSANGGTITDTRNWMDFVDDLGAVGKRLLDDGEFQRIAEGCNQETNISGSADPGTTTGHVDTAGRRMVSNLGCEDCAGVLWQWLSDQSYRFESTYAATWGWYDLPSGKGSLYNYDSSGGRADVKLLAGGWWDRGADCGSRCRSASGYRWNADAGVGARGAAEPM